MPKFITSTLLLLFLTATVHSQKILEKQYDAKSLKTLVINGNSVFEIHVIAESRNTISLKATIAGETSNDVMITEQDNQSKLQLGIKYAPYFTAINDKLSAHKVLSVILEYRIPEKMNVEIGSDIGSFWGRGVFKNLNVSLERGNCFISNYFGNATIMTLIGDVDIAVIGNVSGVGISKNGTVLNNLSRGHVTNISVESRDGNISLTQTEK
ncbi:hypothetical protein ULMS_02410 [Patiriisocius marinistellae]|uniref:Adhesin domain-containing protein n=1 Tax=Patiriisocius marinistellae TaxID=2494560 RepID=A0A5J4FT95_9FLAO|nr:hypothetical protein [Patiriisocius marinistellae]GEQ84733.1 hypothetical protein ULMS_02410 [Patiriisocius marinistellae]